MGLKFSTLTAAAIIAMPMAASAQSSYGNGNSPKALAQGQPDDGLTPAQRASKKTSKPKAQTQAETPTTDAAPTSPTTTAPTAAAPPAAAPTASPQATAPGQTGTTPGQMQATPGEASELTPAQTGTTPSGQAVSSQSADQAEATTEDTQGAGAAKPATTADVKAGASVYDSAGVSIGKIESVSGKNAVLSSGGTKASIPISSFAKNGKGLMIGMTKSEFEAATKKGGK